MKNIRKDALYLRAFCSPFVGCACRADKTGGQQQRWRSVRQCTSWEHSCLSVQRLKIQEKWTTLKRLRFQLKFLESSDWWPSEQSRLNQREKTTDGYTILVPTDSARIAPNEVGVRLHLPRNLYGWGAWMWGSDDIHMEEWGSAQEVGVRPPLSPAIRALPTS